MKSAEFYKIIEPFLAPTAMRNGMTRRKGIVPSWVLARGDERLYLFVKTGKYPWDDLNGGEFSVYAHQRRSVAPEPQYNDLDSLEVFQYADQALKMAMLEQNRRVYEKVAKIDVAKLPDVLQDPEFVDDLKEAHASAVESMSWEIESDRPWVTVNKPLFYYDQEDVIAWGGLIAGLMGALIFRE